MEWKNNVMTQAITRITGNTNLENRTTINRSENKKPKNTVTFQDTQTVKSNKIKNTLTDKKMLKFLTWYIVLWTGSCWCC